MAGAGTGDFHFRVEPDVLHRKAAGLLQQIRQGRDSFRSIFLTMKNTSRYWEGEAGTQYRSEFAASEEEYQKIFLRFEEHVEDLHTIADNYVTADKAAAEQAQELSGDIIV